MQGFIIFDDYGHRYNEFLPPMTEWINTGKIKYLEQQIEGLKNAPMGLLEGKNFGKLVIKVGKGPITHYV
ncbi:hypothetical protein [Zooshikella harenae]|uniref:hypothetical protein n=1 Tax=Zooshikella harenae TaxID=2827238 RepID=UPI00272AA975|nr:hypothetical protein [Zooshikella harenae]